ncbi:hypothetical protein BDP27DRAFT_1422231 [Rhodocollybia butyracea]|uniref:Uncharacterized protein n=1 Tax=Rhodocollybia butyracea TaxID=206335 RepID=A0A9P5PRQ5_9AGAR|nr:hypothetical protein BDP27DRAFT_1422231 [Rhodocollybia butyracea]
MIAIAALIGFSNAIPTEGTLAPLLQVRSSPTTREIDVRAPNPSVEVSTPVTYFVTTNGSITGQAVKKVIGNELAVLSPGASDAVILAAITGLGAITQAVCRSGAPLACAVVGFTAVIGIFFSIF